MESLKEKCLKEIISVSEDLLSLLKDEKELAIDNARFEEEEDFLKELYKKQQKELNKIKNNGFLLMVKNGKSFQCENIGEANQTPYYFTINSKKIEIKQNEFKQVAGKDTVPVISAYLNHVENNHIDFLNVKRKALEETYIGNKKCDKKNFKSEKTAENQKNEESSPVENAINKQNVNKLETVKQNSQIQIETQKESQLSNKETRKSLIKQDSPKKVEKQNEDKQEKTSSKQEEVGVVDIMSNLFDEFNDLLDDSLLETNKKSIQTDSRDKDIVVSKHETTIDKKEQKTKTVAKKNVQKQNLQKLAETGEAATSENVFIKENITKTVKLAEIKSHSKTDEEKIEKLEKRKEGRTGLEDDDFEIPIISETENKVRETNVEEKKENIYIKLNETIMDSYKLTYKEDPGIKNISIIVIPLIYPEMMNDIYAAPILVIAKSEDENLIIASDEPERPAIKLSINGEIFVIRGSWIENKFNSLLYMQNINHLNVEKRLKTFQPVIPRNIGHNIISLDDENKIHIIPLSSKNPKEGTVNGIVCVENTKDNSFIILNEIDKNRYLINGRKYMIKILWKENKLLSKIDKI